MTFANIGKLGVKPGKRDQLIEILTRPSAQLGEHGCLLYEVGVNDDDSGAVFVSELWESAAAHAASLELERPRRDRGSHAPAQRRDGRLQVRGHRFAVATLIGLHVIA